MAKHLGLVIDSKNCVSCCACMTACKVENNVPQGIMWNRILTDGGDHEDTPAGSYPQKGATSTLRMDYIPVGCQHCENPACVKVCPVGATYKDPETGVVRQDYDKCIGCRMCMSACPYTGVRSFNWDEPKYYLDFALGDANVPAHQKHTVEKCTLCWHRIAEGLRPACVEACTAKIRFYGDLDDPESEASKALEGRDYKTLLPEMGTKPSVYYLV